jgi:superfamily II DNA/RNA helicase
VRNAFNSPFRPFVLATTSIGQEGLDFHYYARKIMHWNLPSNAIDLEQREGRINRYKCHAIRKNIAFSFQNDTFVEPIWDNIFEKAKGKYEGNHSELVPFWCLPDNLEYRIERIVPAYPFSKDVSQYERLIKIMSLYRLTMGQARQEDIIQMILQSDLSEDQIHKMFINLSPYFREN